MRRVAEFHHEASRRQAFRRTLGADHGWVAFARRRPDDLSTLVLRAWVLVDWRADLRPFQQLRATLMEKDPAAAHEIEGINYALCERTPEAISRTLAVCP